MTTIEHLVDTDWVAATITKYFQHTCTSCGKAEYSRIRCVLNNTYFCATCRGVVYSFVRHYSRHHAPITWEQRREQRVVYSIDYNLFLTIITSNRDLTRRLMDHFAAFMNLAPVDVMHESCTHDKIMDDIFEYNGRAIWSIGVEDTVYTSYFNNQARFSHTCGLYVFSQYDVFADATNPPKLTWELVNRARRGLITLDETAHGDLDRYIFDPCNALIAIRYLFV